MNKDVKQLLGELSSQAGFKVRTTRRGHHLVSKDGIPVTSIAGTPSDWRSLRNSIAALRRVGFRTTRMA